MLSTTQWLEHLATIAVSGGFVSALAVVCLLQYVLRVWQKSVHRREREFLTQRMAGLANELAHLESDQRVQEQELRIAREILELRSIVDLELRSPTEMLEDFLGRLAEIVCFEQAALYLAPRHETNSRLFVRHGEAGSGADSDWIRLEQQLADSAMSTAGLQHHAESDLRRMAGMVNAPFREAVTTPLVREGRIVGLICLTRHKLGLLGSTESELIQWAAKYLLESMLRTADRAVIEQQARRDALTGLANRHTFDAILEEHVQEASTTGRACTLLLLDMDHFKEVNDRHGHLAGDEALRIVGKVIHEESNRHLRGTDRPLAARYGGEELALILPGVGLEGAERVAEAIRSRIAATAVTFDGVEIPVTLSAGAATAPEQGGTSRELIAAADSALYRAKANGRNRVELAGAPRRSPVVV